MTTAVEEFWHPCRTEINHPPLDRVVTVWGKFDVFYAKAAPQLLAGIHGRESAPVAGDQRWPISVVAPLPTEIARIVDALTSEAIAVAGDGHLRTGAAGSAHVTVRSLERFRPDVPQDDPAVRRYTDAVRSAVAASAPIDLVFTGGDAHP